METRSAGEISVMLVLKYGCLHPGTINFRIECAKGLVFPIPAVIEKRLQTYALPVEKKERCQCSKNFVSQKMFFPDALSGMPYATVHPFSIPNWRAMAPALNMTRLSTL